MKIAVLDGKRRALVEIVRRFHKARPYSNDAYAIETQDHGLVELGPLFYVSRVYVTPYAYRDRKNPYFEVSANDWSVKFQTDLRWYAPHINLPDDFQLSDIRLIGTIEAMDRDLTLAKMLMHD